ncbi:26S proteasome non-ATPase regulatory subunit 2 [Dermatophagoides pteronyssinus]|uniref:26S proteasome non-ATPase regulatory subunit 2 n=1 Tax=Dermatophagoides pteronyssinus TaxID=6956 RepID=A0ABQ8JH28_DERPT|nr:26S proteasome non-ATPase regulatory subunit 2 [Dermatophagoides pteronyssinus]
MSSQSITSNDIGRKNPSNINIDKKLEESSFQDLKLEITVLIKLLSASGNDDADDDLETLAKITRHIDTATGFDRIPDILKVLMLFETDLKRLYENKSNERVKQILADIISYTCTGRCAEIKGQIVKYYMLGSKNLITRYGMSYVRNLSKDLIELWKNSSSDDKKTFSNLIQECATYFMKQNSEIEACDLLLEVEQLTMLETIIHGVDLCEKVCQYLIASSLYVDETESQNILYAALSLYLDHKLYIDALFVAIQLQSKAIVVKIFLLCSDSLIRRQMALILARHNISFINDDEFSHRLRNFIENDQLLLDALSNHRLSQEFLLVAKQLDLLKPKVPHEIVHKNSSRRNRRKRVLLPTYSKQSVLATSFMNCFINAAFGTDKLVFGGPDWIGRHKDLCRMTATATIGILCLWDMQNGPLKVDRFLRIRDENIKAGALMAFGLISTSIKSDHEPAYQLLKDYITNRSQSIRIGSIVGLAMAYLGTNHGDVINSVLEPIVGRSCERIRQKQHPLELSALACGLIAHSTGNMTIINRLVKILDRNSDNMKLSDSNTRDLIHAIGLVAMFHREDLPTYIDLINKRFDKPRAERSNTSTVESTSTTSTRLSLKKYLLLCVEICAYTGSSNILKIQKLICNCSPIITDELKKKPEEPNDDESKKDKEKNDKKDKKDDLPPVTDDELIQLLSIIGIGLISISDQLNSEMVFHTFIRFLKLGSVRIKASVIIAIALTHLSDPKMHVIDLLYKYCHFTDEIIAINAILALGFVCAGTNHARVSRMLTELDGANRDKVNRLFVIKVSQGLLYLGKGLLTLSPQMETLKLLRQSSLASIMPIMFRLFVDPVNDLIQQHHYYLLFIAGSIRPKLLVTLNTEMNSIPLPVRVGQALDTIGVAGWKPRAITAFGLSTTPVVLNQNERAELATESYKPLSNNLEGFVIVEKNTDEDDHHEEKDIQ